MTMSFEPEPDLDPVLPDLDPVLPDPAESISGF